MCVDDAIGTDVHVGRTRKLRGSTNNIMKNMSRHSIRKIKQIARQVESKQFAHAYKELCPSPVTYKTMLQKTSCKYRLSGTCAFSSKYRFLHYETSLSVASISPFKLDDPTITNIPTTRPKSPKLGRKKESPTAEMEANGANTFRQSITRLGSGMFLSQKKYAVEILERAGMVNCNPSRTPVDTESKLGTTGDVVSDPSLYRSLAGSLQYLTFTRPYISYVVQQLFSSSATDLVAYSDADWAGCPTTRRSTLGYCVFFGNNLLSWSSKRQPTLSRSSAEAEYRGVANDVAETCWLRNLLRELHTSATLVYCDNVSAVYLSCNPVQHQRAKHIEIDIHFVRDLVAAGEVRVLHVPSRYQFADIFTKCLSSALIEELDLV
ncbi:ribonuclease H-like domain-containing protein [Tanacetum coccineum]